ncbi:MAG: hypothetical protein ACLGSD_15495 [Acidobacteriota bacterium]
MVLSTDLSNGFDKFLFGIPLLLLLFFGFFRLDETLTSRKKGGKQSTPAAQADPEIYARQAPHRPEAQRASPLSDPDGRPWTPRERRRK